jgi:hypothetical protein
MSFRSISVIGILRFSMYAPNCTKSRRYDEIEFVDRLRSMRA